MREQRELRVTFSGEERRNFAQEAAMIVRRLQELKAEKKRVAAGFKDEIETGTEKLQRLSRYVRDGFDYRDVEIDWMMNYPRVGLKTAIRTDTQQAVDTIVERMSEAEMQLDLNFTTADRKEEVPQQ